MITRTVSDTFKDSIITLEKKCWRNEVEHQIASWEDNVRDVLEKNDSAIKSEILKLNVRSNANTMGGELL